MQNMFSKIIRSISLVLLFSIAAQTTNAMEHELEPEFEFGLEEVAAYGGLAGFAISCVGAIGGAVCFLRSNKRKKVLEEKLRALKDSGEVGSEELKEIAEQIEEEKRWGHWLEGLKVFFSLGIATFGCIASWGLDKVGEKEKKFERELRVIWSDICGETNLNVQADSLISNIDIWRGLENHPEANQIPDGGWEKLGGLQPKCDQLNLAKRGFKLKKDNVYENVSSFRSEFKRRSKKEQLKLMHELADSYEKYEKANGELERSYEEFNNFVREQPDQ